MTRKLLISSSAFVGVTVAAVACAVPAAGQADVSITGSASGSTITVTASGGRFAGAISSLTFRGVQYVNIADHGREIQSALQLDSLGECLNPTEAGTKADGTQLSSSSVLQAISNANNVLQTQTRAAYWLAPGEYYGKPCSPSTSISSAQNQTVLSDYVISRTTSFDSSSPNLIRADTTFSFPENRNTASIEALTGYLPPSFNTWLRYDRATRTMVKLTGSSANQQTTSPVIVTQSNGQHAMGVISPGINGADPGKAYFAYFTFGGSQATSKWSCVYGHDGISAGMQLTYTCLMAVGTVDEVTNALNAYPMPGQAVTSMVPMYRFFRSPDHFITPSYTEGAGAGYSFETTAFHLFPSGSSGLLPLYRCFSSSSGDHFVSTNSGCEGRRFEGILGYASASPDTGLVALHRFFRPSSGDHLITVNYNEGIAAGYTYEGGLGYVAP